MFTRPIFPSPVTAGWNGSVLGFTSSFTPRRYQRRTSTRGQVIEHGPGPTLYVIDLPPFGVDLSMRATSRRTRSLRQSRRGRAVFEIVWREALLAGAVTTPRN